MANIVYKFWLGLRSAFFWLGFATLTLTLAALVLLIFYTPISVRMTLVRTWSNATLLMLRMFCGLHYSVEGLENIPDEGFIIMSKHSSTWETIALQKLFTRPLVWVVKRELTWIPFFGWGLWVMDSIALNRGTGRKAINQLVRESKILMDEGRILMLFPEGTRVPPGQRKPFKIGGAVVSQQTGYAVLPVAHNAGEFWPRHSWIKWPGTIRVVIGRPIPPQDKTPEQIATSVGEWITAECEKISDHAQLQRLGVL